MIHIAVLLPKGIQMKNLVLMLTVLVLGILSHPNVYASSKYAFVPGSELVDGANLSGAIELTANSTVKGANIYNPLSTKGGRVEMRQAVDLETGNRTYLNQSGNNSQRAAWDCSENKKKTNLCCATMGNGIRRAIILCAALSLPAASIYGVVYSFMYIDGVYKEMGTLRTKYCHTQFNNTDSNCMDLLCLQNNDMSEVEYINCYNSNKCWNDGYNPYVMCINAECKNYADKCPHYKRYFDQDEDDDYQHFPSEAYNVQGYKVLAVVSGLSLFVTMPACMTCLGIEIR